MARFLITEKDVLNAARRGRDTLLVKKFTLITPLARDRAKDFKIVFLDAESEQVAGFSKPVPSATTVALGSDHTGVELKDALRQMLSEKNFRVIDMGTDTNTHCELLDYAFSIGEAVRHKRAAFGVMIDGTGVESAMMLNKFPGVRAAMCHNEFTARAARTRIDANVLTLGAKTLGEDIALSIAETFFDTAFEGVQNQPRLNKLEELVAKLLKRSFNDIL
ncbi:sugar-phosphate isomerase, RpiB/LacA/LacB family [Chloroherpeton thalassium ATCC 35110]|uniref:Sugar-phosphate isomerase, RpiB/LacA/LacB family n=1 Tax=Chloroherpeton thalassium (strain ATCC 35110 / GB-78) TaxID=517418 RepID=B3QXZ8_CHLT3|nr:RpiB/LacA/LacB family sugar-phosphate isomerase [Chloroherpeton thalassium]ACF13526.1 sugar-phosphate isomerase, RpiB/LacA/LacB family [Chloroherpeton thalassium ATCC 35110]